MVIAINKQEVKYIKKYFLSEKQRKSRSIKQAEQVGNTQIDFIGLDGKTYKCIKVIMFVYKISMVKLTMQKII